jgi:hypothetical protein
MILKPKPGFLINPLHHLSSDLLGWWLFNEGSGVFVSNYDASSLQNPLVSRRLQGTLVNVENPSDVWRGSIHGGCAYFDTNTQVNFALGEIGALMDGKRGITVSAWVNTESASGSILTIVGDSTFNFTNLTFSGANLTWNIRPEIATVANPSAAVVISGNWMHVVGTCNFHEEVARLYFNGRLVDTDTESWTSDVWLQGTPGLSNIDTFGSTNFAGFIDDLRLFGRALSGDEVRDLYAHPYSNVLTNKLPKFVQSLGVVIPPSMNTGRLIRKRRLLYSRY